MLVLGLVLLVFFVFSVSLVFLERKRSKTDGRCSGG